MVAEDVGVVAFDARHALFFLELLDGGNQVAIFGGAFVFLFGGGGVHALTQRANQIGLPAFEEELHVAHGFLIGLGRGQTLDARPQASADVVLQTRARMKAGQIHFAGGNQKVAVDQVDDAVGEVGREERSVVGAAVFAQAARYIDARIALAQVNFT